MEIDILINFHIRLSKEEMDFLERQKEKFEMKSKTEALRFIIHEAITKDENPDQKYRDLLSQNDENFERVLNALDEQNQVLKVIANALYEE